MPGVTFRSATSLAEVIQRKELSSLEVIDAHLAQIERANPALNALVRVFADAARQRAREADEALARGESHGPFHGVPMTVKDAWELAGAPSTGGTIGRANHIPERDATVIALMRAAGAIPIGMTNVPELSLAFESDNLIYGRTNNPWDPARTPGGSGGGGAAAVAAGMSAVEIGADLGGGIRLPSHFCGIAGLRLTNGRAPLTGYFPPALGWPVHFSASGPMARRVADLEAACFVIFGPDWIDSHVHDVPILRMAAGVQGLRIAVHTNNGIMPARADVAAAVMTAARTLADAGALVEEAVPPEIAQCLDLLLGVATADRGDGMRALLAMAGTDRSHPYLDAMLAMGKEHKSAGFVNGLWIQVDLYRGQMLAFLRNYDLILCPVQALPAIEHGTWLNGDVFPGFSYTVAYNLTGWPAAVVRCGTSPEGLPIKVQAVARPWREDVALTVAQHLETALGGYQQPPLPAGA